MRPEFIVPQDGHTKQDCVIAASKRWLEKNLPHYANQVPLADGDDALKVNWCELTVTNDQGEVLYLNAFITDFTLTDQNVESIVASGRARWKIENENNNTLKTKGYHLEHNFGHGKQHLSSLLAHRQPPAPAPEQAPK